MCIKLVTDTSLYYDARSEKRYISFVMSVCLSVRPSVSPSARVEQHGSPWTDVHEFRYLSISGKSVEEIQDSLKCAKHTGTVHAVQYSHDHISLSSA